MAVHCWRGWLWALLLAGRVFRRAVLPRSAAQRARRSRTPCCRRPTAASCVVEQARDPYLDRDALKISVFMNVFNVHSNRSPVDGDRARRRGITPGSFVNASLDKASARERAQRAVARDGVRRDVMCVQIAGLIARRILCYVKRGDVLARGQRYGFIRFGSRVDLYLPLDAVPQGERRRQGLRDRDDRRGTALSPPWTNFEVERRVLKNRVRRRGIYLLPNLFTTAALFAGFFAIVQAMNDDFEQSALAIFVAMVLDGLDGRVARFTRHPERVRRRIRQPPTWCPSASHRRWSSTNGRSRIFPAAQNIPCSGAWVEARLDRRLRLLRLRRLAARALQHAARGRRQALLPGPAESRRGVSSSRDSCGRTSTRSAGARRDGSRGSSRCSPG